MFDIFKMYCYSLNESGRVQRSLPSLFLSHISTCSVIFKSTLLFLLSEIFFSISFCVFSYQVFFICPLLVFHFKYSTSLQIQLLLLAALNASFGIPSATLISKTIYCSNLLFFFLKQKNSVKIISF